LGPLSPCSVVLAANLPSQPILDVLAEMIAYDGTVKIGGYTGGPAVDVADLMREMGVTGPGLD
jgi:import receptor subunit TOM20